MKVQRCGYLAKIREIVNKLSVLSMNLFITIIIWVAYVISVYFSIFLLLVYFDKKSIFQKERSSLNLPQHPLVSILIPAYNEENTIIRTMESVYNLEYPKEKMEVIVIDDGSQDTTKQKIQEYIKDKPQFRLLSHQNQGKAASLNRALARVKGEFFACLDADSFVDPSTLTKMLALYYKENDPQLAIITPAMKVYQPQNVLQKIQWLEYLVIILIARISSQMDTLYVAPGPFSLYRTSVIRKVGGFDEKNITEDQEIAYRMQKYHYRIKHCFDGYVYTTAPKNLKPFYRQRRRWYLGSMICLHQYKEIIGNRHYGDFGIIQMAKNVMGYFLALSGITLAAYFLFIPLGRWTKSLLLLKLDYLPLLLQIRFRFDKMTLLLADFKKGYIVAFLFLISLFFFYKAHRNANEKINRFGWIPIIPYFAFYYLLKGIILLLSLVEFSKSKRIKW